MTDLRACDVVLTCSDSIVGGVIRWFTRAKGEAPTQVNHVGLMVDTAHIVEALAYVLCRPINTVYAGKRIAVFRPLNLTDEEKHVIVLTAESFIGRKYGWRKIAAHAAVRFMGNNVVTRWIAGGDDAPDCDWLVQHAYAAADKGFGIEPPAQADPDDIWDFVTSHPDKYECVWPLGKWA